ncbi:SDR family NAD(P)-dependent oxidoreductase [Vibrio sp. ZSDE26]|uniref:SDR family NAD(P)-dependent oxidoreductase n=1 Tax=Vibrio amylolyticus TaxID=2847292 RepID=A0A9X1XIX2_9VIBR|nr:SDR family NAD(P)-dependent oxidoreductase [Vibrio amylolyticus]MCK6263852.1 SDR family NAD(P)-dependent oxidoreductase [Vibrio amylolyticus]
MKLLNQVIIITGGTSGIGLEIVKRLSKTNEVIVLGRGEAKLAQLSADYGVKGYKVDLSDSNEVEWVASELLKRFPKVNVLINNAAVQFPAAFNSDDFNYDTIQSEITTNFTSVCSLCYLLLPALGRSGNNDISKSLILNINSGLALAPKRSSAVYCATKAALNSFSISLRYQLEHSNVSVMQALMPLVDTKMTQGRGTNKMTIVEAVDRLISGVEKGIEDNDIGKVGLLRWLNRLSPKMASKLMKTT